jgi:hypothetical protein
LSRGRRRAEASGGGRALAKDRKEEAGRFGKCQFYFYVSSAASTDVPRGRRICFNFAKFVNTEVPWRQERAREVVIICSG